MNEKDPVYGPQVKRPLRVRVLQIASLVLAVAGLILLYLYSINRDIPTVQVSEITPTMNFAYVQIAGNVTSDAYIFKSGGVIFNLHDGSGEIAVMGGRAQAEALENAGKLPRRGDRVEVAGSLSVSADQEIKLRMQSAEQLTLRRIPKPASRISHSVFSIPNLVSRIPPKGETVTVVGTLKEISIPRPGAKAPYTLTLEEGGVELEVIFWDEVFQGLEQKLPTLGKTLSARGRVDLYKEKLQLKVWEAADLRELGEGEYRISNSEQGTEEGGESRISNVEQGTAEGVIPSTGGVPEGRGGFQQSSIDNRQSKISPISSITAEQKGDVFTIVGTLGEPKSIRGGVIYPIADDSGEMVVLFWDKNVSGEERDALESGVRLRVTAPLVVYKGILELIPEDVGSFCVERK